MGKAPGGCTQADLPLEKPKKAAFEWLLPSLLLFLNNIAQGAYKTVFL